MRRSPAHLVRHLALLGLIPAALASAAPATPRPDPRLATRLDPRLSEMARLGGPEPVTVWVCFDGKGETGPADLAARLDAARAALSPRSLQRRLRNHVWPLVDYRDLPVDPARLATLREHGFEPLAVSRWLDRAAVRVRGADLAVLAMLDGIERVEPVERLRRSADPLMSDAPGTRRTAPTGLTASGGCVGLDCLAESAGLTQAALDQIHVSALHDSGYTGAGVLITILDDGFNYFDKHEALRDRVIPLDHQRDFVYQRWGVQDTTAFSGGLKHGTYCYGVIGGDKPGTYLGTAWGASFALARTEIDSIEVSHEQINWALGAEWADSLGADVISSSLGYFTFDGGTGNYTYASMDGHTTIVTQAAEIAASKGILVVTAAGNEGNSPWHYLIAPSDADGDSVLAIGAVDATGNPASFSSYGPSADGRVKPDVAALGVSNALVSASGNPNAYINASGTSFATPMVAGAAACLLQARPSWTARDVARALKQSASHASIPDFRTGYGVVDARRALDFDAVTGVIPQRAHAGGLELLGPNPARVADGSVRLRLLPTESGSEPATVRVFDAQGRAVATVWSGERCTQAIPLHWDARDHDGRAVHAGLYFIRLDAGGARSTLRVVMLR